MKELKLLFKDPVWVLRDGKMQRSLREQRGRKAINLKAVEDRILLVANSNDISFESGHHSANLCAAVFTTMSLWAFISSFAETIIQVQNLLSNPKALQLVLEFENVHP